MTQTNDGLYLCFDPRDLAQSAQDRATWKHSDNAILVASTMLFATHGEQFPIDWDKVSALATLCEEIPGEAPGSMLALLTPVHRQATFDETNALLSASFAKAPRASRNDRRPTTAP